MLNFHTPASVRRLAVGVSLALSAAMLFAAPLAQAQTPAPKNAVAKPVDVDQSRIGAAHDLDPTAPEPGRRGPPSNVGHPCA